MNKRTAIRSIALSAVIAAVYTALTMSLPMLSYGPVQLRFSEALTVLPFFLPEAVRELGMIFFWLTGVFEVGIPASEPLRPSRERSLATSSLRDRISSWAAS